MKITATKILEQLVGILNNTLDNSDWNFARFVSVAQMAKEYLSKDSERQITEEDIKERQLIEWGYDPKDISLSDSQGEVIRDIIAAVEYWTEGLHSSLMCSKRINENLEVRNEYLKKQLTESIQEGAAMLKESDRLAKIAAYWQEEYYKVAPRFENHKIDNL